jgi:hypothetical protein
MNLIRVLEKKKYFLVKAFSFKNVVACKLSSLIAVFDMWNKI